MNYKLYYGTLLSNSINDLCGAAYNIKNHKTPEKLARAKEEYIDFFNKKNGFYIKLEESILTEGIHNPIIVNAGYVTAHLRSLFKQQTDFLVCDNNGGSRLRLAQKHNLTVPCIILDFIGKFANDSNYTELFTSEDILRYFKNPPGNIQLHEDKIVIGNPFHSHLIKKSA